MCRAPQRLLSVSVVFLLAGCSTSLRLSPNVHPAYLDGLRADYMAANPNAPYRTQVSNGEVVKGMETIDVLAAWGHPERRVREGGDSEVWTYVDKDDASGDQVAYTLLFKKGILNDWDIMRDVAGMTAIRSNPPDAPQPPEETQQGKPVPKQ